MNAFVSKTKNSKSQALSTETSQNQRTGVAPLQFMDNRADAVVQREMQSVADKSPEVEHLTQFQAMAHSYSAQSAPPIQQKKQNTGLPDKLKAGVESLAGVSLDDVKVHRNSDKPAQLKAHAFAQGTNIHLGPGQEKHLAHEAWHVVQQKQGRVKPTLQMKGNVNVNDDPALEREADVMGQKAIQKKGNEKIANKTPPGSNGSVIQRVAVTAGEAADMLGTTGFSNKENVISTYYDPDTGGNCHGYTINGAMGHEVDGNSLLDGLGAETLVAVFAQNGEIAHSGLYADGTLTHLLINVGILTTTIGANDTAGYTTRYNLPGDRDAVLGVITASLREEALRERRDLVGSILDAARSLNSSEEIDFNLTDGVNIGVFDALSLLAQDTFIQDNLVTINTYRTATNQHYESGYDPVVAIP